jgi:hypothetical protein
MTYRMCGMKNSQTAQFDTTLDYIDYIGSKALSSQLSVAKAKGGSSGRLCVIGYANRYRFVEIFVR